MTSGTAPQRHATTGVPHAMASITTRPNGSGQSIGKRSAAALPRKARLSLSPISPMTRPRLAEQGLDHLGKIGPVDRVNLRGDLESEPCAPSDGDGAVGPLLGRDPSEEGEIVALRLSHGAEQVVGHPVLDGPNPNWPPAADVSGRSRSRRAGYCGQRA